MKIATTRMAGVLATAVLAAGISLAGAGAAGAGTGSLGSGPGAAWGTVTSTLRIINQSGQPITLERESSATHWDQPPQGAVLAGQTSTITTSAQGFERQDVRLEYRIVDSGDIAVFAYRYESGQVSVQGTGVPGHHFGITTNYQVDSGNPRVDYVLVAYPEAS